MRCHICDFSIIGYNSYAPLPEQSNNWVSIDPNTGLPICQACRDSANDALAEFEVVIEEDEEDAESL